MFITTRTSFHKPFMPYLLLLDSEGIVHYRIDKLEHKRADIAEFTIYKTDGSGAYCGKAIVEHVDTVTGIKAAKAVADMLSRRALLNDALANLEKTS
jgi:hypothetical protein